MSSKAFDIQDPILGWIKHKVSKWQTNLWWFLTVRRDIKDVYKLDRGRQPV